MPWNRLRTRTRDTVKSLAYQVLLRPLPRPFEHVVGSCWQSPLPRFAGRADGPGHVDRSTLQLFEDHRHLGPSRAKPAFIQSMGRGWYRHWQDHVEFSTSDNSDPNTNGRDYAFSTAGWLYQRRSSAPTNFKLRETTAASIRWDVDYAGGASKYLEVAKTVGIHLVAGLDILELGPGPNCGWAVVMACHGARVITADPYPSRWQDPYHRLFFEQLRERLVADPACTVAPISRMLDDRGFAKDVLDQRDCTVELLDLGAQSVDVVFSNAVAEHFYDTRAAFRELFRVTRPGGYGFHWIDYRDHRNFDRPLEYLLLSEPTFRIEFGLRRGEMGNRLRGPEVQQIMVQAGFRIIRSEPTIVADERYLTGFLPRLRACAESPYRATPVDDLRVLGEYVCVLRD